MARQVDVAIAGGGPFGLTLAIELGRRGISVALYLYNYRVGLMALYFLSFLHVFLEFPLNWVSFKGIGEELGKRFRGPAAASTS